MCLLFCPKQTRWGAGPGPVVYGYKPGVAFSDMADWRQFGRVPDFSGRKKKGVIAKTTGCPMTRKGSGRGLSIRLRPQRLDHPLTLGIGGIGCDIASGGASAHGDVRRLTPGIVAWAAELTPGTPLR